MARMLRALALLGGLLVGGPGLAAGLPSLDRPVRTGATASLDTAVIIGIEDYAFVNDVPYARRDAAIVRDWLIYTRGIAADRVQWLGDGAGREQILAAVSAAAAQTPPSGTVWIYFAGHGLVDPATSERVVLGDDVRPDPESIAARGVSVQDLAARGAAGGGDVVMWLDTCHTGAGRDGAALVEGGRLLVPDHALPPPAGALSWSAASEGQVAGALDPVSHGAFTYFAVGALRGWADGELDGERDGAVTVGEAQTYVLRALELTGLPQQPELAGARLDQVLVRDVWEPDPLAGRTGRKASHEASQAVLPPRRAAGWGFELTLMGGSLGLETRLLDLPQPRATLGAVRVEVGASRQWRTRGLVAASALMLGARWPEPRLAGEDDLALYGGDELVGAGGALAVGFQAGRWRLVLGPVGWAGRVQLINEVELALYQAGSDPRAFAFATDPWGLLGGARAQVAMDLRRPAPGVRWGLAMEGGGLTDGGLAVWWVTAGLATWRGRRQ